MVCLNATPSAPRLIAAIAISNGLPLFTANPDDFQDISGLEVVVVPHPDHG